MTRIQRQLFDTEGWVALTGALVLLIWVPIVSYFVMSVLSSDSALFEVAGVGLLLGSLLGIPAHIVGWILMLLHAHRNPYSNALLLFVLCWFFTPPIALTFYWQKHVNVPFKTGEVHDMGLDVDIFS